MASNSAASLSVPESVPESVRAPSRPSRLDLPDGGTAELRREALEIRDREGRLLVRYADGAAEIVASAGDLRLCAPQGRVVVESGLDVVIEASRDVVHRAGRRIDLAAAAPFTSGQEEAPSNPGVPPGEPQVRIDHASTAIKTERLDVQARSSRAVIGQAVIVARAIATTADQIAVNAVTYELVAERLVQRTRDAFREVEELAEERIGRFRAIVKGVYAMSSRRTVLVSSDDTSIDGSRILLG